MDSKKIMSIIRKSEGTKLDFKLKLSLSYENGKKELAKDICAIANSKGGRGYIVVGIEDGSKRIIGIQKEDMFSEEQIQQIVSSRCDPPIPIKVDMYSLKGKDLCIITIYDSDQKPYQIRENGAFYIRRGSTTDIMRKKELVEAFEENINFFIETCPIIRSNINLLNKDLISKYFRNKGIYINKDNIKFLLESAGISYIEKESGEEKCTLGGLLVFSKNNSICVPQNIINIIDRRVVDNEKVNVIQGDVLSMIDKSEEVLKEILPVNYPKESVLEVIKNAVLYREYSIMDRGIEVIISYNSVSIISPGYINEERVRGQKISYHKRNMWLYEKLITLDDKKRFLNNGRGFKRIKNSFEGIGKVIINNSIAENSFKVILPGIKLY